MNQRLLVILVDQILVARKQSPSSLPAGRQVDEMVYALYGLTPEEIAIVEGKAKGSKLLYNKFSKILEVRHERV